MKIIQIVPAMATAITTQANGILQNNKDINIRLLPFHPKKPDKKQISDLMEGWKWCDFVDMQYWKSGSKIREMFKGQNLWERKRKMLTHYNPYNLHEEDWSDYDKVIVVNKFQKSELPDAELIPLSIDTNFFKYSRYYTPDPVVHMAVNRIEGKKGVVEVAQACRELDYKFILVGRPSKPEYVKEVKAAGGSNIEYRQGVSDRQLRDSYYESAIHVCNSVDFFESGTMPILEAMSCGIPVLTRWVGHVPDLYEEDETCLRINHEKQNNVESIKEHLKDMMDGRNTRIKQRLAAEQVVKSRSNEIRAARYRKVYEEMI